MKTKLTYFFFVRSVTENSGKVTQVQNKPTSTTSSIFSILSHGSSFVTSKLSNFVSSAITSKQGIMCRIQEVMEAKLMFFGRIFGQSESKRSRCERQEARMAR